MKQHVLIIGLAEGCSCGYGSRTRYDGQSVAAGERSGGLLKQKRRLKCLLSGSVHLLFHRFQWVTTIWIIFMRGRSGVL